MRFFTSLFLFASTLIPASAQLPAFSREAWADSLSPTPKLTYGKVAIGQSYVNATSAVTQWSNPAYYTKNPGFLDSAPIIDPIQYRLPDVTFNATFADGYPRAWHVWFPKNYKPQNSGYGQDTFTVNPYNRGRFNIWYVLHGFTDNAFYPYYDSEQEWPGMPIWSNLTAFTYYNNYILVAPEGLINKINTAPNQVYPEFAWNAGINRCCSSQNPPQDDVNFLTQVRNRMTSLFQPKKQFLTGYSNGGYMVQRMACERRDLWDAFVTNAATVNINGTSEAELIADCDTRYASRRGAAKPMLLVHGQNDQRVSYQPTPGFASQPANFLSWGRRNGCSGSPSLSKNLYSGNNTGLTSNYFFNTVQAKFGTKVKVYPPGVTNETFNGNPRYFGLNRLPFASSTQSFSGYGCTLVELVSHYDYHVWPKRTTSIADNWIYHGNDVWELNEYAHSFFTRTCGARFFTDEVIDEIEINSASTSTIVIPVTIFSMMFSFILNY